MKEPIRNNLIIILLVLVIILLVTNIKVNKKLLKEYIDFTESNLTMADETTDDSKDKTMESNKNNITDFDLKISYKDESVSLSYNRDTDSAKYIDNHTGRSLTIEEATELFKNSIESIEFDAPQSQVVDLLLYELDLPTDFTTINLNISYLDSEDNIEYSIKNN